MSDTINRIDIAEFRQVGYLQELNRRFLHPLGLALEVTIVDDDDVGAWRDDIAKIVERCLDRLGDTAAVAEIADAVVTELWPPGREFLSGVWDYRHDPEGIYFDGTADPDKAARVDREWRDRAPAREAALGYVIEPAPKQPFDTGRTVHDGDPHRDTP